MRVCVCLRFKMMSSVLPFLYNDLCALNLIIGNSLQTIIPGLVVMGDDSCLRGRGFESRHWMNNIDLLLKLYCLKTRK